jgi:hypothetical protein
MKIGIDISQLAFEHTGVATFLKGLVEALLAENTENEFVLFYSSMRKEFHISNFKFQINSQTVKTKITIKKFKFPPTLLDLLWNKLHIFPIEWLIGPVDVFITSDWTEPPTIKAKKATIVYDLIVYKYPEETHNQWKFNWKSFLIKPNIVASQKRKLHWVQKESSIIFCISEATKKDAIEILGVEEKKLKVMYPGM